MKGGLPIYDHRWKKVGIIISAAGLIGMIVERFKRVIIIDKYNVAQHYALFEFIMLFGLFVVISCKEKVDDERTQMVRRKAYQMGFNLMGGLSMVVALNNILHQQTIGPDFLFVITGLGIMYYLLFFHIGLYFDFLWDYDDKSMWENLRNRGKNKWSLLVYYIASAIILLLLTLMQYS
jgi:hypothetical protein